MTIIDNNIVYVLGDMGRKQISADDTTIYHSSRDVNTLFINIKVVTDGLRPIN